MKAAAPQAPGSTHHHAKIRAKGREAPATSAAAAAFAGVLAKAVAAKAAAPASSARIPTLFSAAGTPSTGRKGDAARQTAARRNPPRAAGQRRLDETTAAEVGRTAASAVQTAAASRPAEGRIAGTAASARRTEPRVHVLDLRRKPGSAEAAGERPGAKSPAETTDASAAAAKPFAERLAVSERRAMTPAPARATPLERIREMTGSDLVRTAGLVVRDGGGEIRLTLKPGSLGSVRIRLSLEDGKVEGRIVVDTPEARQAFEAGVESLARALQADGFRTGSLSVSVSGGHANDSRQAAGLLGDTIRGARLRDSDEALQAAVPLAGWTGGGDGLVNVFA